MFRCLSLRRPLAAALCCAGVHALALEAALAAEPCSVELVGPERAAWQGAASDLGRELEVAGTSSRCRSVRVDAAAGGATLVFVAADGRRAERALAAPAELVPSVQALSASAPALERHTVAERPEPADTEKAKNTTAATRSPSDELPVQYDAAPRPDAGPYASSPVFGAALGFRTGADNLISPTIGATAALLLGPWELGLLGRFEGKYVDNGGEDNETRPETSGIALGVTTGRRETLGSFALRGGGALIIAEVREETDGQEGGGEARVGLYGGSVWPKDGWLGLRLDLSAELVPYNIGRSEQNALGNASLPWWAIGVAVGPEFR